MEHANSLASAFKVVGYVPSWAADVKGVPFDKLTHVNYAFLLPEERGDGSLEPLGETAKLRDLVSAAHAQGVRVMISVGGWNDGNDRGFERLAANATATTTFVENLVRFVEAYDLDGVDIDWEYPDPGDSARSYAHLMRLLSAAMHRRGNLLTAAVVARGDGGSIPDEVFGLVDFLTLMAYDGEDGPEHSPYSYAEGSLDHWLGRGLPAAKAVLGVPFYGRPTWAAYSELAAHDPQVPYSDTTSYGGKKVYYNGIPTIQAKTELALRRGGGVMIWELSQDTGDNTSLLTAIHQKIQGTPRRNAG